MRIEQVPPDRVWACWDSVLPGLKIVLRKCPDYWRPEDVYHKLKENKATLFLLPNGFFICEIYAEEFTKTRIFNVWVMYFPGAEEIGDELMSRIDEVARFAGCQKVRFVSPRPWHKKLGGKFRVTGTIYERTL